MPNLTNDRNQRANNTFLPSSILDDVGTKPETCQTFNHAISIEILLEESGTNSPHHNKIEDKVLTDINFS